MSDQPRDWDKELADIDKVIASSGTPAAPATRPASAPPAAPAHAPARAPAHAPAPRGRERAETWLRTALVVALGAGLLFWPYAISCGFDLALYTAAVIVLIGAALWAAAASWRRHQGIAHVTSLLALVWGLALGAGVLLPRIGYAREVLAWTCG